MIYPDEQFFAELAEENTVSGIPLTEVLEKAYRAGSEDALADAPGKAYRVRKGDHVHPKVYAKIGPAKQARSYHDRLKGGVIEALSGHWIVVDGDNRT